MVDDIKILVTLVQPYTTDLIEIFVFNPYWCDPQRIILSSRNIIKPLVPSSKGSLHRRRTCFSQIMTSSNINDVFGPEMFVNHIFKYLSYNDLRNASQTCTKWRKCFIAAYKINQQIRCKFFDTLHKH